MKSLDVITDRIIAALDEGTIPWRKPWKCGGNPRNFVTGKPYRGINVFLTGMQGYASPYWLTFKQAKDKGGCVRKGEKGTPVIFWNWQTRLVEGDDGEIGAQVPFMRYYTVFNLSQVEGITVPDQGEAFATKVTCEGLILNMPQAPAIEHGWTRASYNPASDIVKMPPKSAFKSESAYYAVVFHELTHSTGHVSRLNRQTITARAGFGTEPYCKEELIAEFGAAFLCGHAGIEAEILDNSTAYIDHWRRQIAADKRLIVSAAAQAQKAVDFILGTAHGENDIDGQEAA